MISQHFHREEELTGSSRLFRVKLDGIVSVVVFVLLRVEFHLLLESQFTKESFCFIEDGSNGAVGDSMVANIEETRLYGRIAYVFGDGFAAFQVWMGSIADVDHRKLGGGFAACRR
jgi:hypothetical protein